MPACTSTVPTLRTMVAIVLDDNERAALERAGLGDAICSSPSVTTAPHRAVVEAGLSLMGRELHLCHEDAEATYAPPPVRCPVLERRLAALRARAADAEYACMVRDVARSSESSSGMSKVVRDTIPHASIALNVVATMGTCFAAAYFLARAATGSKPIALAAGAVGLAIALAVETSLVLTRLYALERAAEKETERHQRAVERRATNNVVPKRITDKTTPPTVMSDIEEPEPLSIEVKKTQ